MSVQIAAVILSMSVLYVHSVSDISNGEFFSDLQKNFSAHSAYPARYIKMSSRLGTYKVPEILEALTTYVLQHVKTEGLFRIGGSNGRVGVLQERLLNGAGIPSDQPVQDVCTVMKRWLREQSLFGKCVRPKLPPRALDDLKTTLTGMSHRKFCILWHVCKFLQIVAQDSASNLMDVDNLAAILGESVFVTEVKVRNATTAEDLKRHSEVAKQSMKLLIENVDVLHSFVDRNFRTPEHPREHDPKKSFTTRMKSYGSALKNLAIKRSRSLYLGSNPAEFMAPQLFGCEERIRLRERRGVIRQDSSELLERRYEAIARRIERIGHQRQTVQTHCHNASTVAISSMDKENATPIHGRALRDFSLDEPHQLEWKPLPRDSVRSSNSSIIFRY